MPGSAAAPAGEQVAGAPRQAARRFAVIATGDIIPHLRIKGAASDHRRVDAAKASLNHEGYDAVLEAVKPALSGADVVLGNLETPIAPKHDRVKAFRVFNGAPVMLDALAWAGYNLLSFANNHGYDQGRPAFEETLGELKARGLGHLGAGLSAKEAMGPTIREKEGMAVCFFGATRLLNGNLQPKKEGAQVVYVPYGKGEKAASALLTDAVAQARAHCSLVLLSIHWGVEYAASPHGSDRMLARKLVEAGVDGILGHHSHTPQPIEVWQARDGRPVFVAWSLGNFMASMGPSYLSKPVKGVVSHPRDSLILKAEWVETPGVNGQLGMRLSGLSYQPVWVDRDARPGELGKVPARIARPVLMEAELALAQQAIQGLEAQPTLTRQERSRLESWKVRRGAFLVRKAALEKLLGPAQRFPPSGSPSLASAPR